jgi:hypothetical protein
MTTFTLQDLNLPATAEQAVESITKEKFMEYGMNNPISTSAVEYATQHAPVPQPTLCESTQTSQVNPEAVIDEMLYTIKRSLLLLATVIKEQPNTTPPEGVQGSLQETVALVLKQSDWFKDMVAEAVEESIDNGNFEDAVSSQVSSCVDSYFCHEFSLDDHCDVNEMVNDAVSDKIEEVVAEKLESASVSISF